MGGESAASSALSALLRPLLESSLISIASSSALCGLLASAEGGCELSSVITSCSDAQAQSPTSVSSSRCAVDGGCGR